MDEVRASLLSAFAEVGITAVDIEARMGRPIDKLNENDVVKLRHLYSAIKDGFVKAADAFGTTEQSSSADLPSEDEENALEALNRELTGGRDAADS